LSISALVIPTLGAETSFNKREVHLYCRFLAVKFFFHFLLNGDNRVNASKQASKLIWNEKSTNYRYKAIRKWAREYMATGDIRAHRQGKHAKHESVLSIENVKQRALLWIAQQRPAERSLRMLKQELENVIIPDLLGGLGKISEATIQRYMRVWGYKFRDNNKDVYYDGHEREDVQAYRLQWSRRMMKYKESMDDYIGDDESEIVPPLNIQDEKLVMVTHDESTFYANDGKQTVWLLDHEHPILKKGQGLSIMVSEFQCPCHGTMRSDGKISRVLFHAGANRDGYWTSEDMVKQLKDVIPLFEELHPNCRGVFLFDQSSNHNAYPNNALVANRMTLRPKMVSPNDKYEFKDTKFWDTIAKRTRNQSLYTTQVIEDGSEVKVEFKGKKI
jgi:hypothetical protein